jgi:hypothetical protein
MIRARRHQIGNGLTRDASKAPYAVRLEIPDLVLLLEIEKGDVVLRIESRVSGKRVESLGESDLEIALSDDSRLGFLFGCEVIQRL